MAHLPPPSPPPDRPPWVGIIGAVMIAIILMILALSGGDPR